MGGCFPAGMGGMDGIRLIEILLRAAFDCVCPSVKGLGWFGVTEHGLNVVVI